MRVAPLQQSYEVSGGQSGSSHHAIRRKVKQEQSLQLPYTIQDKEQKH